MNLCWSNPAYAFMCSNPAGQKLLIKIDLNCGKGDVFGNHINYPKESFYSTIKLNYRLFIVCTTKIKKNAYLKFPRCPLVEPLPKRLNPHFFIGVTPSVLTKIVFHFLGQK